MQGRTEAIAKQRQEPDQQTDKDEEYFGYDEASKLTGLKVGTLYSLVARNQIPHIRLTQRLVLFSARDLAKWLTDHKVGRQASQLPDRNSEGDLR